MKNVVITGSSGFLGKNLQEYIKSSNLKDFNFLFPKSKDFNCLDLDNMRNYIENKRVDIVIHLAAKCGGILANKNSPADFLRDNTLMGLNIYEIAREYNIQRVYSLGSVCSYPVNCPVPFKETDIWNGPAESTNFPYGQAKRTLMMLSQTYREQYGVGGAFFLPANLYGSFDHFDLKNSHVIPALINKFVNATATNQKEVNCWGTGMISREFLYAKDCCSAIIQALQLNLDEKDPINLGNGKEIFIKELAETIAKLTGYKGKVVFTGEVSDGQPRRCLDVSRSKKILKWKAQTSLKKGLEETIKYFNSIKI